MVNHTVNVTMEEQECVLDLEYNKRIPEMKVSETDIEDLKSDAEIYPTPSSSRIKENK